MQTYASPITPCRHPHFPDQKSLANPHSPLENANIQTAAARQTRRQSRAQSPLGAAPPTIVRIVALWRAIRLLLVIHALLGRETLLWMPLRRITAWLLVIRLRLLVLSIVWTGVLMDSGGVSGRSSGIPLSFCFQSGTVYVPTEGRGETIANSLASGVHVRDSWFSCDCGGLRLRKVDWRAIAVSAPCGMLCCIDRSEGLWERIRGV